MSRPPWQRPSDEIPYSPHAQTFRVEDVMNSMHHLALHDNSSHFQPFIPYTGAGGFHTQYQPYPYHSYPIQPPAYPPQLRSEPTSSIQPSLQFSPHASTAWASPPMASNPAFPNTHAGTGDIHSNRNYYPPPAWVAHAPVGQNWKHNGQVRAPMSGPAKVDTFNRPSWAGPSVDEKARERKAYHPQPPTNRSDWVMWVGNVPPNTTHEELWKYFNSDIGTPSWRGPSSIFLISRSSCAFVNLTSEEDLARAVAHFNGRSLRPWDPRCPRLVCRVRKKDDDLRSGVGAQRGTGMHRDWVKQQQPEPPSPAILEHPPEGEGRRRESIVDVDEPKHNSSASCASTNSSFLARNFPMRCFILKSATTSELEESVRTELWRTQRHNEPVLDQAFRTSQEVFLIFGANKSGEFFGFAKMIEPIDKEKAKKYSSSSASKVSAKLKSQQTDEEDENARRQRGGSEPTRPSYFLLPSQSRITSTSPGEITPAEEYRHTADTRSNTDPTRPRPESRAQQGDRVEYFPPAPTPPQPLDAEELPHIRTPATEPLKADADGVLRKDTIAAPAERDKHPEDESDERGSSFHIQWIKVGRLPFNQTRQLRNPWNADREVKVSRDGTEVEPAVGKQLMSMWDDFPIV